MRSDSDPIKYSESIGHGTNNEAEYKALIKGLDIALNNGLTDLEVYGDSKLVIMQSQKLWKINKDHLKILNANVLKLSSQFKNISFHHIPRNENKIADYLSNEFTKLDLKI